MIVGLSPIRSLAAGPGPAVRLMRIAAAVLVMSLGLVAAMRLIPQAAHSALAALCLGGLALYALGAFATGAVSRDDWASLTKNA